MNRHAIISDFPATCTMVIVALTDCLSEFYPVGWEIFFSFRSRHSGATGHITYPRAKFSPFASRFEFSSTLLADILYSRISAFIGAFDRTVLVILRCWVGGKTVATYWTQTFYRWFPHCSCFALVRAVRSFFTWDGFKYFSAKNASVFYTSLFRYAVAFFGAVKTFFSIISGFTNEKGMAASTAHFLYSRSMCQTKTFLRTVFSLVFSALRYFEWITTLQTLKKNHFESPGRFLVDMMRWAGLIPGIRLFGSDPSPRIVYHSLVRM